MISKMHRLFLLLFVVSVIIADNSASNYVPSNDCGEPLILTPLIKKGEINTAREKSCVTPLLPNIFSHSGYLTVNETANSNLFFWFFKQSSPEWSSRPVILWLQGGPGSSSMFGLFTENGPFRVSRGKLAKNKYSWTKHYNVLFIDNPIGTGFSFTDNYYVTTQQEIGQHLFDALTQFFTMFPELRKNKFFISGESYAGKYLPALGYEIYKRNPKSSFPINLKGIFIGNGYTDPENMMDYAEHLHRLGLVDRREKLLMQQYEEDARILIRNTRWGDSFKAAGKARDYIYKFTNFSNLYDYIDETFDGGDSYIEIMNDDEFRKTIHVGQIEYKDYSYQVYLHLKDEINRSMKPQIEELLEVYPIMFFSGQLDIIVGHYLSSSFINQLHWSGADGYSEAKRNMWYVNDHLAGYYKTFSNLKEALIRDAGHMVPAKKPMFLLDLLCKFVDGEL
ncbi:venom serine carboxypeptidase-like [Planococcus citri]|uniref:venom serine carboxypeptidase-like n=1 Tax=Planococcus citri TaxID=170843 RepID=UPI0031F87A84